jgi:hypothetical protein
MWLSSLSEAKR